MLEPGGNVACSSITTEFKIAQNVIQRQNGSFQAVNTWRKSQKEPKAHTSFVYLSKFPSYQILPPVPGEKLHSEKKLRREWLSSQRVPGNGVQAPSNSLNFLTIQHMFLATGFISLPHPILPPSTPFHLRGP